MITQVVFFALASSIGPSKQQNAGQTAARRIARLAINVVLTVALVMGIVLGMMLVGGEPLADRLGTTREELSQQPTERTHADRASIWKGTLQLCLAHPITGVGLAGTGWLSLVITMVQASWFHNKLTTIISSSGLQAVSLVSLSFYGLWFWLSARPTGNCRVPIDFVAPWPWAR
jgi:O-antigen ligase